MNYEKFNDAMCRLRQAEEDFNTALKDVYAAINEADRNDERAKEVVKRYQL